MKYAERIMDITNAFKNDPLENDELKSFYCDGTMEGIDIIIKIIEKRASLDLFEENVLDTLIRKTGGSLRDLWFGCQKPN